MLLGVDRRCARDTLREHREDLDALDRVDAEVGLHPHVQAECLFGIARGLRDHREEERHDVDGVARRRRRLRRDRA
jgi:hypothetical protein